MQHLFYFPPGASNSQQRLCKAAEILLFLQMGLLYRGKPDKLKGENWKMGAITCHRRLLPSCVSIQKRMITEVFKDADKL